MGSHRVLVIVLAAVLSATFAFADDSPQRRGPGFAYYEGALVEINLKYMPVSSWDSHSAPDLPSFYDGSLCFCTFGPDSVGFCACLLDPPVLHLLDEGPLYRAFGLMINPDGPPFGALTSFSQVEDAIASGAVSVLSWSGVYRLTVQGPKKTNETAVEATSWGRLKAIYR